ncbi:MAG: hypothetical protein MJ210_04690 [Alphaproteobacteria bacterium]|nr:hypothetical protein [Alphaproteobacteria bacterium]
MKKLFIRVVVCFFLSISFVHAAFVEGLEDIPLAEGLTQIENESLNFGNEESRLIEAYFKSDTSNFNSITDFYKNTLPQMGWKLQKQTASAVVFEREGEILDIRIESQNPLKVRLTVKSKN